MKSIFFIMLFITTTINAINLDDELIKNVINKCEANDEIYCYMLGKYYGDEYYIQDKNNIELEKLSIKYLTKACNLGNGDSCGLLSEKYKYIFKNDEKSIEYAIKGCDSDSEYSCVIASLYYANSPENDEKNDKTKYFSDKACELGYSYACNKNNNEKNIIADAIEKCGNIPKECYNAAILYKRKYSKSKYMNLEYEILARKFSNIACDRGYGDSCALLGMSYRKSLSNSHTLYLADEKLANKLLEKGCDKLKSAASCDALAVVYDDLYKETKQKQYKQQAIVYFNKGCELGNKRSCNSSKYIKKVI